MGIKMSHGSAVPLVDVTLGMRLAAARKHAQLTQDRMAELMGASRRTITRWESDDTPPAPAVIMSYSVATDVNLAWLATGVPDFDGDGEFVDFMEPRQQRRTLTALPKTREGANEERPRSGVRGRSLPGLDSNQEPAGFKLAAVTHLEFGVAA